MVRVHVVHGNYTITRHDLHGESHGYRQGYM